MRPAAASPVQPEAARAHDTMTPPRRGAASAEGAERRREKRSDAPDVSSSSSIVAMARSTKLRVIAVDIEAGGGLF